MNNANNNVNLSRRSAFFNGVGAAAAAVAIPLVSLAGSAEAAPAKAAGPVAHTASTITTRDGVEIYY